MLFTPPDQVKPITVFHLSNPEFLKNAIYTSLDSRKQGNWKMVQGLRENGYKVTKQHQIPSIKKEE